mgnify:FL=1
MENQHTKTTSQRSGRTAYLVTAGVIAALYTALTFFTNQVMSYLSWGPVQFRVSEALMVLAFVTPAAIPGLTLGNALANLLNLGATGAFGWFDVIFGSIATLLAAIWIYKFRKRPIVALLGPVIANALIVPAYLPIILQGLGLYKIPLLGIDLEGNYLAMYLFGFITVGLGEAVVVYGLGLPLRSALKRNGVVSGEDKTQ